jgi:hypothetical protein
MNTPNLGVSSEDPGKFVLGTVPVESDGSAFFRVPSGIPVFFQALDRHGNSLQTMRNRDRRSRASGATNRAMRRRA